VFNLINDLPAGTDAEIFTEVLLRKDVRIERIVSNGQFTPPDKPHRQSNDEWVCELRAKVSAIFVPATMC
jgi:cupin 2 domain-containing protein